MSIQVWRLLHFFFAFGYVGALIVCEWSSRAARATEDPQQRILLWGLVRKAGGMTIGTLLLLGVIGNILSVVMGYRMAADGWSRWVNALWLLSVLIQVAVILPVSARILRLAQAAAGGGTAEGYASAIKRWRIANAAQSVLYLALLVLMAFHWRG
jgi:hypothetical protein